jgi:hypothetical protein
MVKKKLPYINYFSEKKQAQISGKYNATLL